MRDLCILVVYVACFRRSFMSDISLISISYTRFVIRWMAFERFISQGSEFLSELNIPLD